jgi:hypothetical protein
MEVHICTGYLSDTTSSAAVHNFTLMIIISYVQFVEPPIVQNLRHAVIAMDVISRQQGMMIVVKDVSDAYEIGIRQRPIMYGYHGYRLRLLHLLICFSYQRRYL